jgi:nicotinamidase-related amidase
VTLGKAHRDKTAFLIIDAQQEYFAPIGKIVMPDGPRAVEQIALALRWAGARGVPVFHIVHQSRRPGAPSFVPGSPALAIHPAVTPEAGEPVIQKHLPGSFTNTPLEEELRKRGIDPARRGAPHAPGKPQRVPGRGEAHRRPHRVG